MRVAFYTSEEQKLPSIPVAGGLSLSMTKTSGVDLACKFKKRNCDVEVKTLIPGSTDVPVCGKWDLPADSKECAGDEEPFKTAITGEWGCFKRCSVPDTKREPKFGACVCPEGLEPEPPGAKDQAITSCVPVCTDGAMRGVDGNCDLCNATLVRRRAADDSNKFECWGKDECRPPWREIRLSLVGMASLERVKPAGKAVQTFLEAQCYSRQGRSEGSTAFGCLGFFTLDTKNPTGPPAGLCMPLNCPDQAPFDFAAGMCLCSDRSKVFWPQPSSWPITGECYPECPAPFPGFPAQVRVEGSRGECRCPDGMRPSRVADMKHKCIAMDPMSSEPDTSPGAHADAWQCVAGFMKWGGVCIPTPPGGCDLQSGAQLWAEGAGPGSPPVCVCSDRDLVPEGPQNACALRCIPPAVRGLPPARECVCPEGLGEVGSVWRVVAQGSPRHLKRTEGGYPVHDPVSGRRIYLPALPIGQTCELAPT